MPTIDVSNLYPGDENHVIKVLERKHPGFKIELHCKMGSEVIYSAKETT